MSRVLPILFNTEMVRAILEGKKTVARRICKDANEYTIPDMDFFDADKRTYATHDYADKEHTNSVSILERPCPICPGDILYVRETWAFIPCIDCNMGYDFPVKCYEEPVMYEDKYSMSEGCFIYREDYPDQDRERVCWSPSIHMPKQAARIWLKVTDVRAERLQEIDGYGILAEGIDNGKGNPANGKRWENMQRMAFSELWNSTIKKADIDKYGWAVSPWVWVIEFERCEKPKP